MNRGTEELIPRRCGLQYKHLRVKEVFVFPSVDSPAGTTVMEYMSTGSDEKEEIDLLINHLNVSEVLDIMENLYASEEPAVYEPSLMTMCPDSNQNKEHSESLLRSGQEVPWLSSVRYGTVEDLLAFANHISNTTKHFYGCRPQESGILLNMVCFFSSVECCVFSFVSIDGTELGLEWLPDANLKECSYW